MARIAVILKTVGAALKEHRALELTLVSRRIIPPTQNTVSFPARNENQDERFSIFTMLLTIIHYRNNSHKR